MKNFLFVLLFLVGCNNGESSPTAPSPIQDINIQDQQIISNIQIDSFSVELNYSSASDTGIKLSGGFSNSGDNPIENLSYKFIGLSCFSGDSTWISTVMSEGFNIELSAGESYLIPEVGYIYNNCHIKPGETLFVTFILYDNAGDKIEQKKSSFTVL